jgi:hypothetical protein
LRFAACVTGDYLDARVYQFRTGFDVDREGALPLAATDITWDQVVSTSLKAAEEFPAPRLAEAKERSVKRVQKFIEEEEPRYRVLMRYRSDDVERLSGNLTDERLELELHQLLAAWRQSVKTEVAAKLK